MDKCMKANSEENLVNKNSSDSCVSGCCSGRGDECSDGKGDNVEKCCCKDGKSKAEVSHLKTLEDEVEKLRSENKTFKDSLLRCYADMDNLKKRADKEKEEALKFSASKFAKDLLSVLDNFDMAVKNTTESTDIKTLIDGIKITEKAMLSALQRNGLVQIEASKGDDFDHNFHQIMCEIDDSSIEPGKISEIYQKGYLINGRLLRPALVGIAKRS